MSKIVKPHQPCNLCNSSDASATYEEGSKYCFSCKRYTPAPGFEKTEFKVDPIDDAKYSRKEAKMFSLIEESGSGPITARGISDTVTRFFGIRIQYDENRKDIKHAYPYSVDKYGVVQAYKLREVEGKKFSSIGKIKGLCGQHLFPAGGRRLVITEGEIDMMSVAEMSLKKYEKIFPVVSIRSATTLKDDLMDHRDWIRSFDEVVLCFDNDTAGKTAVDVAAKIIGFDKVKITSFGVHKDPNEILLKEGFVSLNNIIWSAQQYVPAGIIDKDKLWESVVNYNAMESTPYPACIGSLNVKLKGLRQGELDLFVSGTGSGKSTVFRELVLNILSVTESKIGIISLEESPAETARRLSGMALNINTSEVNLTESQLKLGFETVFGNNRILLLDHQGSVNDDSLIDRIEYMALMGCRYILLDHITLAVSEGSNGLTGNEAIDSMMSSLLKLLKRHSFWLGIISHLRKTPANAKASFEEGAMPNMDDIKGSGSIKQIAFGIIAFARDQLNSDPLVRSKIEFSVLKNRYAGLTGPVSPAFYNLKTGRLQEEAPAEGFKEESNQDDDEARELAIEQLAFEAVYAGYHIE